MDRLCDMAPNFVWDFLEEKLEHIESGIHSTRGICLCEYIKLCDKDAQSDEQSNGSMFSRFAISASLHISRVLRCGLGTVPIYTKLSSSPELTSDNEITSV